MKVLLIKDVFKLGRAGEIKKVAAGYGRNYLIPKGFAIPATPGAMHQAERIKVKATERRAALNEELGSVAEVLDGKKLTFAVKAGETGRLYGSVSDDDILEAIQANFEIALEKRQVETEPIRQLGTYKVPIHLTMDLMPEIMIIVHREDEDPEEQEETKEAMPENAEVTTVMEDSDSNAIGQVGVVEEVEFSETPSEEPELEESTEAE
ncbi:MAG: 50S ribosomal protein L9 [Chloroflexota bacterium]|nr:50S ribosomal protein L9 [Chloroflexota bacterium]